MCGIAGYARFDGSAGLDRMVYGIRHGDPDDVGFTRVGARAGLSFARLSIVDFAGGHQLFLIETGDVQSVVNGKVLGESDSYALGLRDPVGTP